MTSPEPTIPDLPELKYRRREWLWLLCGVVLMLLVYGTLAGSTTLWDRDEPRFSRAAVEMIDRGDYVVPWFNGEWRLHKPIMVYWVMIGFIKTIGQTELAFRLPSILGMIVTCLCTYGVGRRLFDVRTARWAFVVMATSILSIYMGQAATADGLLSGFIALSIWAMVERVMGANRWWVWPIVAVGLAGAMLTKGPVGLGVVWLTAGGFVLFGRKHLTLGKGFVIGLFIATLVSLAAFLAWAIPANEATDGMFYKEGIGEHVIDRSREAREGHGGSGLGGYLLTLPLYIPMLLVTFMPWSLDMIRGGWRVWKKTLGDKPQRAVLLGWIVPTFVLFSLVATKLPHYILPIFPALAVMVGAYFAQTRGKSRLIAAAGVPVVIVLLSLFAMPRVEADLKPSPRIAEAVRAVMEPGDRVYWDGYQEASLVFYLDLPADEPLVRLDVLTELPRWASGELPGVWVVTQDRYDLIEQAFTEQLGLTLNTTEHAAVDLVNYSSEGRKQRVLVLTANPVSP